MFDIGIPEILFILLLMFIVFGPKEMQEMARELGRWMNRFVKSDTWRAMRSVGHEISTLPTRLMREAEREIWENDPALREQKIAPPRSISFSDLPPSPAPASPTSEKSTAEEKPSEP
jgi:Sec-independent protein translocase protein TatA